MMKTLDSALRTFAVAGALAVGFAASVSAATFQGDFGVNFNDSDPGLVVQVAPDYGSFGPFDLEVGEWKKFHIFDIWTDETAVNHDDKVEKPISVDFAFTSPSTSGTLGGTTDGKAAWFGIKQYGKLDWNNPLTLNFGAGNTGQLSVYLFDEIFNKGYFGIKEGEHYGAKVYAKVKYDVAPIPLPAAGWLLLGGIGGLAALRRRKAAA